MALAKVVIVAAALQYYCQWRNHVGNQRHTSKRGFVQLGGQLTRSVQSALELL